MHTCSPEESATAQMYAFRFGISDETVHLTQRQLNRIPYLLNLVARKDDFASIRNEHGEYVLNHPIEYAWFLPILCSIMTRNPYTLFDELSEDNNALDVLQLYDYLGVSSFRIPLLKHNTIPTIKSPDQEQQQHLTIKYNSARVSETRRTAAEFVFSLSRKEYDLSTSDAVEQVFQLSKCILSEAAIFSTRFRQHTLTVIQEHCYSYLHKSHRSQLPTTMQLAQCKKLDAQMYLPDDKQASPLGSCNSFAWRGAHNSIPKETAITFPEHSIDPVAWYMTHVRIVYRSSQSFEQALSYVPVYRLIYSSADFDSDLERVVAQLSSLVEDASIYQIKDNRKSSEAYLARSGCFNTRPQRPTVDRFKHRCGPKAQKHR